jgi:hypothetical protein
MTERARISLHSIPTAVLTLILLLPAAIAAQQAAGIIGQVTDESGAVLPGVTVTATSPALQVPTVTAVTDGNGEYRLTPLPIGTYVVEYSLAGFQGVRHEGVRLTIGFTARMDVGLKVGALQETVTVSGQSPVVDTTSTTTSTQFTRESIELLPSSRNGVVSLLAQAPGVRTLRDVGGSSINTVPTFRVFGQAGEAYSTLEGVQTSSLQASSGQANYWDYTTIEEASVRTIGNSAEVPSRGVNLNAIVKSGSNVFHGSAWYNKTSSDLQSDNVDAELAAQGVEKGERLDTRHSYSADLGGRIIRDKLWFYGAARRAVNGFEVLNSFKPDGSPAVADDVAWFATYKLSYQMSASNKFVGFHQQNHKHDLSELSQFRSWDYRGGLTTPSHTAKIEWQKLFGNSLVTNLQYGRYQYYGFRWNYSPRNVVPSFDQVTLIELGPQTNLGENPQSPRDHFKGALTWFRPDLFYGNHELKVGVDHAKATFGRTYPEGQEDVIYKGAFTGPIYNYRLIFQDGAPYRLEAWNMWSYAHVVSNYTSAYVQDSWTLGRRLTLNLGLRYAHDNGYVPESCREAALPPGNVAFPAECYPKQQFNVWDSVAPRLHAAWDLAGDGKTVIKGGWGRFDHQRQQVPEMSEADPQVRTTVVYRWRDLNANRDYDLGEVNLNPNGPDFVSQSGGSNAVASPDEVQPKLDEVSVSLERELLENFALRVSGIYAQYHNTYRITNLLRPYETYNVPVTRPDPGPDGRVGSADDPGVMFTYWEYPTALSGRNFERLARINDPNADQTFTSIDLSAFKRLSNRWQLLASYSATLRDVPVQVSASGSEFNGNVESGPDNPNGEINTSVHSWEWTGKVSGVYVLPYQISTSATFEHRSGYPWARQVRFTGGTTIPNITVNVEPYGTRTLPHQNQVDFRVEKSFNLRAGQRATLRMNIFNLLNDNTVLELTRLSGATFGLPTSIMPPRIAEFSVSYNF